MNLLYVLFAFSDVTMHNTEKHCDLFGPSWLIHLFCRSVWTKKQKIVNGQGTVAKLFLGLIFFGLS